jgi:predicted transposase YdaD
VCIKHFKYLQEKTAIGLTTQEEDFMKTMQEIDAIYQAEMQRARWEGAIDGKQEIVLRQLQRRIGNISTDLEMQVKALSSSQLEQLADALFDFTQSSDLVAWLDRLKL